MARGGVSGPHHEALRQSQSVIPRSLDCLEWSRAQYFSTWFGCRTVAELRFTDQPPWEETNTSVGAEATSRDPWCNQFGCLASRLHVDAERLGTFRPAAYSLIISTMVFEHLSHPEQAFASVVRSMTPGGWLLLTAPFFEHNHGRPWDFHRYTYHALFTYAQDHHLCIHQLGGHGYVTEDIYAISKLVAQKPPCTPLARPLNDPSLARLAAHNGYEL